MKAVSPTEREKENQHRENERAETENPGSGVDREPEVKENCGEESRETGAANE